MRKAIRFLVVLWGLSVFFDSAFPALDDAATASFNAVEAAANASKERLSSTTQGSGN